MKLLVVVGECDLELVGSLVGIFPSSLTVALRLSRALVLLNDLPVIGCLSGGVLVLEHATHAENGLLLVGVVFLLLAVSSSLSLVLTPLLISPVTLVLRIEPHALMVH